jgi:hypothetical protein
VSAEHEGLEGKYQSLEPENQGVHECKGIYNMKSNAPGSSGLLRGDSVVIVGTRVGHAATARRYALESTFIERFKKNRESAWPGYLLWIN